ncbi:hypothetical protein CI109_100013 [Kwoniella shandongensis]|uniref:Kinase n=1 Tax=Kwoniella shandongensis TaxID=1734106 RepID=A0A5M6BS85_9TREE|nr:uncharacterized protein CI109_006014 [Kwoniella shandongensis]KAA5525706.1 hypothetical protein CI109_006014 [Kwoniella shandongensis]
MPLPLTLGESTPLADQVAGHAGVLSDSSGSLVIKPALAREIAFYQMLGSVSRQSPLGALRKFTPKFLGTLRLEGQLVEGGGVDTKGKEDVPESVVIENLSYSFTHPNILDVKLGTVLYGPDASEEKRARMDKQGRETTTHETGVRLTGCQTWHAPSSSYISTPKSFGKTISVSQLPTGMTRFFPLPTDSLSSLVTPLSPPPTATTDDSEPGHPSTSELTAPAHVPAPSSLDSSISSTPYLPPTPITASNTTTPTTYSDHAIPPELLLRVLDLLLAEIDKLVAVLQQLEIRFVGGSVLIVYEGDPTRLASALEQYVEKRAIAALKATTEAQIGGGGGAGQRSAFSDDGSNDSDDDDEDFDDEDDDEQDDDDISLDGTREDERRAKRCPPLRIKMIDFAHTWLAEGEGPDEGVLKGLMTLRGLVEGRKKEVDEHIAKQRA